MREIKFRIWNPLVKQMQDARENTPVMLGMDISGIYIPDTTLPVMQYTGLTDCKGKEIYEGDIVLVPIGYPEDGKPIYGNFQGVIVYGSPIYFTTDEYGLPIGTTGFFIETKDGRHSMLLGRDEKVIGNIYENKELLESE